MASMSLDDLIAAHLVGLKEGTRKVHRSIIRSWLRWCSDNLLPPLEAGPEHIDMYGRWLLEQRGLSESYVYTAMGVVCGLYADARRHGLTGLDPTPYVHRPHRYRHSSGTSLSRQEAARLLDAAEQAPDARLGALVCLLLLSGLRAGEVLHLDIEDYKRHPRPTVRVHRKGAWDQGLAITDRTAHALDRLIGRRRAGPIFLGPGRKRLTHHQLSIIFDALTGPLGLNRVTPHSLRRTFATLSREAGVPDKDILAAGGWSDRAMLDYYDMDHHALQGIATDTLSHYLG